MGLTKLNYVAYHQIVSHAIKLGRSTQFDGDCLTNIMVVRISW